MNHLSQYSFEYGVTVRHQTIHPGQGVRKDDYALLPIARGELEQTATAPHIEKTTRQLFDADTKRIFTAVTANDSEQAPLVFIPDWGTDILSPFAYREIDQLAHLFPDRMIIGLNPGKGADYAIPRAITERLAMSGRYSEMGHIVVRLVERLLAAPINDEVAIVGKSEGARTAIATGEHAHFGEGVFHDPVAIEPMKLSELNQAFTKKEKQHTLNYAEVSLDREMAAIQEKMISLPMIVRDLGRLAFIDRRPIQQLLHRTKAMAKGKTIEDLVASHEGFDRIVLTHPMLSELNTVEGVARGLSTAVDIMQREVELVQIPHATHSVIAGGNSYFSSTLTAKII